MLTKNCFILTTSVLVVLVSLSSITATSADPSQSYDILYHQAVEAYLDERWDVCVTKMNEAIEDWHFYLDAVVGCRLKCHRDSVGQPLVSPQLEDMKHWERLIKQTLCILKCKKGFLKNRAEIVDKVVAQDFDTLKPYDYLQLCYFKSNDAMKAASCAYTFLTVNPEHQVMKENLRFYIDELKIDPTYIINLEAKPYVELYIRGGEAYKKQDYARAANYFEMSLFEYLQAQEECRAQCEGPFDQGWFPDFISSISNHYTFTLRCKQRCTKKLGNLNGQIHEDLLPSHYHYLQFIYYKLGDLHKACQSTASYLLFFPNDEVMNENKEFYETLDGVNKEEAFKPRPEALQYIERDNGERALLGYIEESFHFDEGEISEASYSNDTLVADVTFLAASDTLDNEIPST